MGSFKFIYPLVTTVTGMPSGGNVADGASFTLTCDHDFSSPAFQWTKNGQTVAGETASTYDVTAAIVDNGANFACSATEAGRTVTSAGVTMNVACNYLFSYAKPLGFDSRYAMDDIGQAYSKLSRLIISAHLFSKQNWINQCYNCVNIYCYKTVMKAFYS